MKTFFFHEIELYFINLVKINWKFCLKFIEIQLTVEKQQLYNKLYKNTAI